MASQALARDTSPPGTIQDDTSSPKTLARRKRNLSTPKDRMERTERAKLVTSYQGEDTELFWTTVKELSEAPFPFLDQIKNRPPRQKNVFQIRKCYDFLTKLGYYVIAPKDFYIEYNPVFLAMGSSKNTSIKKKKKKKGGAARTRRAGHTRRS